MPAREGHETIFECLDAVTAGETLRLVNDHDAAPLRYQLVATRPDQFRWE
jgi:regulator of cell morphogenesis and NO signaling